MAKKKVKKTKSPRTGRPRIYDKPERIKVSLEGSKLDKVRDLAEFRNCSINRVIESGVDRELAAAGLMTPSSDEKVQALA